MATSLPSRNILDGTSNPTTSQMKTALGQLHDRLSESIPDGRLIAEAGTAAAPSLTTTGDTNTGLYFPAADTVGVAVGGVNVGDFTSAGFSGNAATATDATNATNLVNGNATLAAGTAAAPSLTTTGDTNTGLYFPAADTVAIATGGTEAARITSDGNLLLGTTTAFAKLAVNGGIYAAGGNDIQVGNVNNTNAASINSDTSDTSAALVFKTAAAGLARTERARITSDGNWLVGINSPYLPDACRLEIFGSPSSASTFRAIGNASAGAGTIHLLGVGGITNGYYITKDGVNNITHIWDNQSGEAARITSGGNLLVGYNTSNGAYKLQVNSQIFATSSTIATSDGRYKENITPIDGALNLVKELNPVQFSWKKHPVHAFDTETPTVGFIAQELQQVLADRPYLNSIVKSNECTITAAEYETIEIEPAEEEIKDEDGNVLVSAKPAITEQRLVKPAVTEEFLGIAEGNLIAILTKAIQEQQTLIESLTARITALESK